MHQRDPETEALTEAVVVCFPSRVAAPVPTAKPARRSAERVAVAAL